jgi:WD40 repeat protein
MLATAGGDWTVRLWDPSSRTPIGEPLTAHSDSVDAVAFNPDGTLLASAGRDGTVRLWDLASGAPIGDPLEGHTDWVEAVAFSPDGSLLASASLDGTVRLWDAILDPARACELAAPYVRRAQVLRYLPPDGVAPTACVEID